MANTIVSPKVRTALQVATARAKQIAREEWASRLDPAAYRCERQGEAWVAEGPAGQRFEFTLGIRWSEGHSDILCASHSGECYTVSSHHNLLTCSCPAAARSGDCKHIASWIAVRRTVRAQRAA